MKVDDSHLGVIDDPILRQILASRGIKGAEDLDNTIARMLSPYTLTDLSKAAQIIADAIVNREHIMIAGDYDIDGMTGTALGVRCLKAFGLDESLISYYVPSRYEDGYGLNPRVVDRALASGVSLIITVDNGISAFEAVAYAKEKGLKVVVTDHHEVQDKLPVADAVVDHKRKDDSFASNNLCGVGVLFYVMIGTRARLIELGYYKSPKDSPNMSQFLDLVTLGTIGDVMALDSNNRRLVKAGLKRIHKGQMSLGIQALLNLVRIDHSKLKIKDIAFALCPRFNAATRIRIEQNPAILNLLSEDEHSAMIYARQLDMCNRRRMDHEKVMLSKALSLYKDERMQRDQAASEASLQAAATNAVTASLNKAPSSEAHEVLNTADSTNPDAALNANSSGESGAAAIAKLVAKAESALTPEQLNILKAQRDLASQSADAATSSTALSHADIYDIEDAYNDFDAVEAQVKVKEDSGIVIYEPTFLTGLLGLVANKMKERYHKPCIIFGADQDAKVDDGINLMAVLDNNPNAQVQMMGRGSDSEQEGGAQGSSNEPNAHMQGMASDGAGAVNGAQGSSDELMANKSLPEGVQLAARIRSAASGILPSIDVVSNSEDAETKSKQQDKNTVGKRKIVGSARSVPGIDLMQVFKYIKEREPNIFVACGGHSIAAGATIIECDVPRFKELFNEACSLFVASDKDEAQITDCTLPDSHVCLDFAKDLELFGPWGKEFDEPRFDGIFTIDSASVLQNRHLKLKLRTSDNRIVEAIKFRASLKDRSVQNSMKVQIIYTLGVDRYFAQERLQLNIEAIEPV